MPSNAGQETERIYGYWAAQLKKWYDNANANENGRIEFCLTAEQAQRIGAVMESECVKLAQQMGASRRSAERWLQQWTEIGILQKNEFGQYAKISA